MATEQNTIFSMDPTKTNKKSVRLKVINFPYFSTTNPLAIIHRTKRIKSRQLLVILKSKNYFTKRKTEEKIYITKLLACTTNQK